jgi:hypothetical protein
MGYASPSRRAVTDTRQGDAPPDRGPLLTSTPHGGIGGYLGRKLDLG